MASETAATPESRVRVDRALTCACASALFALAGGSYVLATWGGRGAPWLLALLALDAVVSVAGGVLLWQAGRWPSHLPVIAEASTPPVSAPPAPTLERIPPAPVGDDAALTPAVDEVETLLDSFSRMLGTIEMKAQEIDRYAARLDSAYKEIESSSAQLKEFSFKDEVTGLYNRRFFSIRLEEEVSRYRRFNHPVSVVLLDLDAFKEINDDLGHAAGDETLRGMAEILLRHSRGINVICRYGGDEFAILLVETSKAGARLYADRIRYVLPSFRFAHGRRVTASFGIASLPEDVTPSPEALIRAADEALYAAKRAGKNRVSVYEEIRAVEPEGTPPAPA